MKTPKPKSRPRASASSTTKPVRKSKIENQKSEIVLLAVTGMSPAVLTETVWALAQENPPVVPDRIIVITTTEGSKRLQQTLFTPCAEFSHSFPTKRAPREKNKC